jgi:Flp pilus assembly pilin Flp
MKLTQTKFKRFILEEAGVTATEYAILLAAIVGLILFSLTTLGNSSGTFWGSTADTIEVITR